MKQNWIRCTGFLLILALLLAAVSWLFYPKDNRDIGLRQDRLSTGLLAEKDNTVDVLFLGDSLPFYGIASIRIWGERGIPCYTYATPQQNLVTTRRMLRNALRHQSPRIVVLETNVLFREIPSQEAMADRLYELVPAARYHDNWKKVPLSRMLAPIAYEAEQESKGYYLCMTQSPAYLKNYMECDAPEAVLPEGSLELLRSIRDICAEHEITLVLCSLPNALSWSQNRHKTTAAAAEDLGLPYLDLNTQDLGIDWDRDCLDYGDHLNYLGARKVTDHLADWLWNTGMLEDKRSLESYAHWNEQYAAFSSQAEKALAGGLIPQNAQ